MKWVKSTLSKEMIQGIMKRYNCDILEATFLARRGILEGGNVLYYLENDVRYLHNPFLFKNMEDAVDRIMDAIEEKEKVLIFGDRDVDGITSVTLLYETFSELGMDVDWKIPIGDECYGLSCEAVDQHVANGGTLIVTVDCGISNFKEIEYAREKGVDVIIIDHHTPQEKVPNAIVIINPKMEDSGYPNSELSGCAVAWKLLLALRVGFLPLYKMQICLLNIKPLNDAFIVEAVKLVNMVEVDRISEIINPNKISFYDTRLPSFLHDQQIYVWDAKLQHSMARKTFGGNIEFNFADFREEMEKVSDKFSNLSLLRLKESSQLAKYSDNEVGEIDIFVNLFISFTQRQNNIFGKKEMEQLQLVSLSTLSDLMELRDENRILVRLGLEQINKAPRRGILDLLAIKGLHNVPISSQSVSWNISPLINATGRMGSPETAIHLFLERDGVERNRIAKSIVEMNERRKQLCQTEWDIALPIAYQTFEEFNKKLVVVASKEFNRGITGILSGKLAEFFKVPSIVICSMDNGESVASLRSARNYRLLSILEPYSSLFLDYGGHAFAAGCRLLTSNLPIFMEKLKEYSFSMEFDSNEEDAFNIDIELPHKYLTPSIVKIVDKFEPYGICSSSILFMCENMKILNACIIGRGDPNHLKMTIAVGNYKWSSMYWKEGAKLNTQFKEGDVVDAVFNIERNAFNGNVVTQLIIKDMKLHKDENVV